MKKKREASKVMEVKIKTTNTGSIDFSNNPACADMGAINSPAMIDQKI